MFLSVFQPGGMSASVSQTITFEGYTLSTENITEGIMTLTKVIGSCYVDDNPVYAGSRSYCMKNNFEIRINFSMNIYKFLLYFYPNTNLGDFKIYGYNSEDVMIIRIDVDYVYESIVYYDFENNFHVINTGISTTDEHWYGIGFCLKKSDSVDYYYKHSNGSWVNKTDKSPRNIDNNFTISYIKIVDINSDGTINIDNIYFDSYGYTDSDTGNYLNYKYFGCSCNQLIYNTNKKYVEKYVNIPLTMTIKAFDLFVDNDKVDDYSKQSILLYLNGINVGHPSKIFSDSGCGCIRWSGLNISLNGEKLVVEIGNFQKLDGYNYWYLSVSDVDCDGDGNDVFLLHNDDDDFGDGFANGDVVFFLGSNYDINYKVYYQQNDAQIRISNKIGSFDEIDFYGDGYLGEHSEYGIKNFYQNSTVYILYNVDTLQNDNVIHVYYEGDETGYTQFYPYTVHSYSGVVGFVPYNVGNYTVKIIRNSIEVANKSFYSSQNSFLYNIWSIPVKTSPFENFKVCYNYKNTEKDGKIGVFAGVIENSTSLSKSVASYYVEKNSSGCMLVSPPVNIETILYLRLFVQINNNSYEPVGNVAKHFIVSQDAEKNVLRFLADNVVVGNSILIRYSHLYYGCDVYVFINGQKMFYVGNSKSGDLIYTPDSVGFKTAELKVLFNNTWYVLANDSLMVSSEQPGKTKSMLDDYVNSFTIGVVIFFVFIVVGLKIKSMYNADNMIVVVFAFAGFCACVGLGFWDKAYLFAFTVLMFIFILYRFVGNRLGGG